MKNPAIWAVVVIVGVLSFFADDIASDIASSMQNSAITFIMTGLSNLSTFVIVVAITSIVMWRFKGQVIVSRKLHGKNRQTSKLVYRITVLYRHLQTHDEHDNPSN